MSTICKLWLRWCVCFVSKRIVWGNNGESEKWVSFDHFLTAFVYSCKWNLSVSVSMLLKFFQKKTFYFVFILFSVDGKNPSNWFIAFFLFQSLLWCECFVLYTTQYTTFMQIIFFVVYNDETFCAFILKFLKFHSKTKWEIQKTFIVIKSLFFI